VGWRHGGASRFCLRCGLTSPPPSPGSLSAGPAGLQADARWRRSRALQRARPQSAQPQRARGRPRREAGGGLPDGGGTGAALGWAVRSARTQSSGRDAAVSGPFLRPDGAAARGWEGHGVLAGQKISVSGMAGVEPTPSESQSDWTPLSPWPTTLRGAILPSTGSGSGLSITPAQPGSGGERSESGLPALRVRWWVSRHRDCGVRVQALPVTVTMMVIPSKLELHRRASDSKPGNARRPWDCFASTGCLPREVHD
jgi:hypothetical protein